MTDAPRTIQPDERGAWADALSAIPEKHLGAADRTRIADSIRGSGILAPDDEALIRRAFVAMVTPPSGPLARLFRTAERIAPPDAEATDDRNIAVLQKIFGGGAEIQTYGVLNNVPIYIVEAEGLRWEVGFYPAHLRFLAGVVDKKRIIPADEEIFLKYRASILLRKINENIGDFNALTVTFAFGNTEIFFVRESQTSPFPRERLQLKSNLALMTPRGVAWDDNIGVNEPMIDDFVASIESQPGQVHHAEIGGGFVLTYDPKSIRDKGGEERGGRVSFIMQEIVAGDSSLVARVDTIRARLNEVVSAFEAVKARLDGRKFGGDLELNLVPEMPASFFDDVEELYNADIDELDRMRDEAYETLENLRTSGGLTLEAYRQIADPVIEKAKRMVRGMESFYGMNDATSPSDETPPWVRISEIHHDFINGMFSLVGGHERRRLGISEEGDADFSGFQVPKDLAGILGGASRLNKELAGMNGVRVEINISENLQVLAAHDAPTRRRIQRILDNLIHNSIKYHNPEVKEQERYVKVSVLKGIDTLLFLVEDNGRGMNPEDAAKYGTGWRDPAVVEAGIEGTGRGSGSVVARITELDGRLISIETEPGKGTKILFSVPADVFVEEVEGVKFTARDQSGYKFRIGAPEDLVAELKGKEPADDLLVIFYPWDPRAKGDPAQQMQERYVEGIRAAEKIGVPSVVLVDDHWNGKQLVPYTTALVDSEKIGDIEPRVQTRRAVFAGGSLFGVINRSIRLFANAAFDRTKKGEKVFTARLVPDAIWIYKDEFSDYYNRKVGVGKTLKQVIEEAGNDPKEVVRIVKSLIEHPAGVSLDKAVDIRDGKEVFRVTRKARVVLVYQGKEYVIREGDNSRVLRIEILDDFPFELTEEIKGKRFIKEWGSEPDDISGLFSGSGVPVTSHDERQEATDKALVDGLSWGQYRELAREDKARLRSEFAQAYKRGGAEGEFEAHPLTSDESVGGIVAEARHLAESYPDSRIYSLGNSAQWFVYAAILIDNDPNRFSYIPYFPRHEAKKPDPEKFRRYLESIGLDPKSIVARDIPTVIVETPISGDSLQKFLFEEILSWAREEGILKQVLYKLTLHVFSDEETKLPFAVQMAKQDGMTIETRSSPRKLARALVRSSGVLEVKSSGGDRLIPGLEALVRGETAVSRTAALGRFRVMDYMATHGMAPDTRPRKTPPVPLRNPAVEAQASGPRGQGTPPVPLRNPVAPPPVAPVGKPGEHPFLPNVHVGGNPVGAVDEGDGEARVREALGWDGKSVLSTHRVVGVKPRWGNAPLRGRATGVGGKSSTVGAPLGAPNSLSLRGRDNQSIPVESSGLLRSARNNRQGASRLDFAHAQRLAKIGDVALRELVKQAFLRGETVEDFLRKGIEVLGRRPTIQKLYARVPEENREEFLIFVGMQMATTSSIDVGALEKQLARAKIPLMPVGVFGTSGAPVYARPPALVGK